MMDYSLIYITSLIYVTIGLITFLIALTTEFIRACIKRYEMSVDEVNLFKSMILFTTLWIWVFPIWIWAAFGDDIRGYIRRLKNKNKD
jgi:hypothetical protein